MSRGKAGHDWEFVAVMLIVALAVVAMMAVVAWRDAQLMKWQAEMEHTGQWEQLMRSTAEDIENGQ